MARGARRDARRETRDARRERREARGERREARGERREERGEKRGRGRGRGRGPRSEAWPWSWGSRVTCGMARPSGRATVSCRARSAPQGWRRMRVRVSAVKAAGQARARSARPRIPTACKPLPYRLPLSRRDRIAISEDARQGDPVAPGDQSHECAEGDSSGGAPSRHFSRASCDQSRQSGQTGQSGPSTESTESAESAESANSTEGTQSAEGTERYACVRRQRLGTRASSPPCLRGRAVGPCVE